MKSILNLIIGLVVWTTSQAQYERLELKLTKGETYIQNMKSNVSILQTMNGQEITMKMSVSSMVSFKVIDIQNEVYDMEVRYENLVMKIILPNGEIEFSSEKVDEEDIFSTILKNMKNKPFLVKKSRTGKVIEVKNIEAIFSNMFDKLPELSNVKKQQIQGQIMQAYGEKAFKGNLEMCSVIFNDSVVSNGDKWTIHTQLESGMSGDIETVYELNEITDNYYRILGNSKIVTADKDAYIESNGMPLKYDLSGIMTSMIVIDKKTGWTTNAIISQSITGTAYIKDNPKLPGGMAMPMTMTNEMIITEK